MVTPKCLDEIAIFQEIFEWQVIKHVGFYNSSSTFFWNKILIDMSHFMWSPCVHSRCEWFNGLQIDLRSRRLLSIHTCSGLKGLTISWIYFDKGMFGKTFKEKFYCNSTYISSSGARCANRL